MQAQIGSHSSTELRATVKILNEGNIELLAYRNGTFSITFIPNIQVGGGTRSFNFCGKQDGKSFFLDTEILPARYVCLCTEFYEGVREFLG
jgi:hypothetical protein